MKKFLIAAVVMAAIYTGCGDSATEVAGTLPVVTGITVDTLSSRGDTIVVMWDPVQSAEVEGYFLWNRTNLEGPWYLASTSETSPGVHIASRSGYYTVMAFSGNNTSSDTGLSDNTKTTGLSEIREAFSGRPVGFRVDIQGDSLIAGDPSDPGFNQHFVVAMDFALQRYVFPGSARPEIWPGGARTLISDRGGFVAPSPGDTLLWDDSIRYGGNFYLSLDNNYFCLMNGAQTLPDTLTMTDTLVIDGQLQPIQGVRVFND